MKHFFARSILTDGDGSESSARQVTLNIAKLLGIMTFAIFATNKLSGLGFSSYSTLTIHFLAVMAVSFLTPRYKYGILAAVIAAIAFNFFITEPRFSFGFAVGHHFTLPIMLVVTFLCSYLATALKKQAETARRRENRAELLSEISSLLMGARTEASIIDIAAQFLREHLPYEAVFYCGDPLSNPAGECGGAFSTPEELNRVHRIFVVGEVNTLEDETDIYYQPVFLRDTIYGVIGVDRGAKALSPSQNFKTFLQLFSRQVGLALELQKVMEQKNELKIGAEKEKMHANLLRSISHDLRTPLTSILGAGTALLEQQDISAGVRTSLLEDILENASWLIRMVENILTVTRISGETVRLRKTLEAAEEVVSQSVAMVRKQFPGCYIHIKIPDELLMVPMDAVLISQVLINLLENAVKNSDEDSLVLLTLTKQEGFAKFEVSDHGCGIPEHLIDSLFEIHPSSEDAVSDTSRGIGIGLSICKTIILAHGGTIEGGNRAEGGAKLSFLLPLEV